MILSRVTDYLRQHRRASLGDMALALDTTPDALREMLAMLERKGRARRLPAGTACGGGCNKCSPASVELYEWGEPT
ncbi:MAG: FeoC-like transcriptional regulator [Gammaproteobacteria bacterium]|nr:FeoC-like transcriptional regulator [Gammaproteobacteria bacterium]MBU1416145.1 FeoC-like transcriptional regulator [Gammaproteobacteria bacterium]